MMIHRKTAAATLFTLGLSVIDLIFPGQIIAQSPSASSAPAHDVSSNWNLTITAPPIIEASNSNLDFYVKCKLTNLNAAPASAIDRAHICLIDSGSHTQMLYHYPKGYDEPSTLATGQTITWWQHARATNEGPGTLFARWDGTDTVQSASIPTTIHRTVLTASYDDYRNDILRRFTDRYPEIIPNTSTGTVSYTCIDFTNDPVVVDGNVYQAITFVVPPNGGDLEWSLVIPLYYRFHFYWYIVPADNCTIPGFDVFFSASVGNHFPDIAEMGDLAVCQILPSEQLIPLHRYYIWFQCDQRDVPHLAMSVNIFPEAIYPFHRIFHRVYNGDY